MGLVWGFCALPVLMLPRTLRKPIFKVIRHPTIRNPTIRHPIIRPYTKKQRKPINPKQGKSKPGPPSHGETTMARQRNVARLEHVPTGRQNFDSRKRALDSNRMATEHKTCHPKDPEPFQPKAWTSDLVPPRELNSKVTHVTKVQQIHWTRRHSRGK